MVERGPFVSKYLISTSNIFGICDKLQICIDELAFIHGTKDLVLVVVADASELVGVSKVEILGENSDRDTIVNILPVKLTSHGGENFNLVLAKEATVCINRIRVQLGFVNQSNHRGVGRRGFELVLLFEGQLLSWLQSVHNDSVVIADTALACGERRVAIVEFAPPVGAGTLSSR
jgi:hypothetical protein